MTDREITNELPPNYEELKKAANRTSNWRERLAAVEELGKWHHPKSIDILTRLVTNDAVYPVREAAYRKLRQFGEDVKSPTPEKGDLFKGVTKIFLRIKKSLPAGHTYEQFKEKLQKMRTDVYDTYEGEKGADFDKWLETQWASLPTR